MTDKNDGVLAVLRNMQDRLLFRSDQTSVQEQLNAVRAVAELLAAAERMRDNFRCVLDVNCKCDGEFIDKQTAEIDTAIRAMRGDK